MGLELPHQRQIVSISSYENENLKTPQQCQLQRLQGNPDVNPLLGESARLSDTLNRQAVRGDAFVHELILQGMRREQFACGLAGPGVESAAEIVGIYNLAAAGVGPVFHGDSVPNELEDAMNAESRSTPS